MLKGIVLAGGKSSRFGKDKALARWEGTTLLERAVNLLTVLDVDPAVIASSGKNYAFLNCPVHNDIVPEKGPIGGLHTAFLIFPDCDLLALTCDMPLATEGLLRDLVLAHHASGGPVVFEVGGVRQPFPGIYAGSIKKETQACLSSNQLSMKHFLSLIPDLQTLAESVDPKLFLNVNTPEDLN